MSDDGGINQLTGGTGGSSPAPGSLQRNTNLTNLTSRLLLVWLFIRTDRVTILTILPHIQAALRDEFPAFTTCSIKQNMANKIHNNVKQVSYANP